MFGIGLVEIVVILGASLIVVGPNKLPQVAVSVARFLRQCRMTIDDIKRQSFHRPFEVEVGDKPTSLSNNSPKSETQSPKPDREDHPT